MLRFLLLLLLLAPGALRAGDSAMPSRKVSAGAVAVLNAHHQPVHAELAPLQALLLPAARVSNHLVPGSALLPAVPGLRPVSVQGTTGGAPDTGCEAARSYLRHNYPAHGFW
ncbi:MAG: hypothetical protein EOO16_09675 [Chitinophagaceae bacterium]|nr:MAG: hypothetical protein EOO16_09675 [Chitinophagaceae bacterium]